MKRFNMIDEEFICENCHQKVNKLNYTARDHCPYCLCNKIHKNIIANDDNYDLIVKLSVIND